mgnify:CR=1 FL=1
MPSQTMFNETISDDQRLRALLTRLDQDQASLGVGLDSLCTVSQSAYWKTSGNGGRRCSRRAKVFGKDLLKSGFVASVDVPFADALAIPKFTITETGRSRLAVLRGTHAA